MTHRMTPTITERTSRVHGADSIDQARGILTAHGAPENVRIVVRYDPITKTPVHISDSVIYNVDGERCDITL